MGFVAGLAKRQNASEVPYSNLVSMLTAINVQDAIDELATSGGSGADNHSGYYLIPLATTVTVSLYKQMVFFGQTLIIDGSINIDGQLILEA